MQIAGQIAPEITFFDVGAEVKEAKAGTFDIKQDVEKGEEITGFKADKIG